MALARGSAYQEVGPVPRCGFQNGLGAWSDVVHRLHVHLDSVPGQIPLRIECGRHGRSATFVLVVATDEKHMGGALHRQFAGTRTIHMAQILAATENEPAEATA